MKSCIKHNKTYFRKNLIDIVIKNNSVGIWYTVLLELAKSQPWGARDKRL